LYALHVTDSGDIEKMPWAPRYGGLAAHAHKQAEETGRHHAHSLATACSDRRLKV
jgi:hypothetical protein